MPFYSHSNSKNVTFTPTDLEVLVLHLGKFQMWLKGDISGPHRLAKAAQECCDALLHQDRQNGGHAGRCAPEDVKKVWISSVLHLQAAEPLSHRLPETI